jgi:hypothetical protein
VACRSTKYQSEVLLSLGARLAGYAVFVFCDPAWRDRNDGSGRDDRKCGVDGEPAARLVFSRCLSAVPSVRRRRREGLTSSSAAVVTRVQPRPCVATERRRAGPRDRYEQHLGD